MGFRQGAYAKVWKIKRESGKKYTDVQISTSKKDKDGNYNTDFSSWVRFIGKAHEDVAKLNDGDRIKLGEVEVTNSYDKAKNVTYTNYAVYTFEDANSGNTQPSNSGKPIGNNEKFMEIPDNVDDEELPFN